VDAANTSPRSLEISVCIPVRNEETSISALIDGLLAQTQPPAEIVICDNGSTDATKDIVEGFVKDGAPVKLIREDAGLPGRGRNVAVANSRCQWIAFIDAGVTPETVWLEQLAQPAKADGDVQVVYGTYEPVTDSLFKLCAVMAYVAPPYEVAGRLVRHPSVVSMLMQRRVWENVGGFPENLRSAEDLLFMRKIARANVKTVRAPDALVHWQVQSSIRQMFKRFVRYSQNNIRAGLFGEWQGTIFIYYAILGAATVKALTMNGVRGLFIPPGLWLLFLLARAARAVYRNRKVYPANLACNLARLFFLVPIIAALDAATFAGSLNWLLEDKLGLMKPGDVRNGEPA